MKRRFKTPEFLPVFINGKGCCHGYVGRSLLKTEMCHPEVVKVIKAIAVSKEKNNKNTQMKRKHSPTNI